MTGPAVDDDLWSAIGDPTRRRLLDLLLDLLLDPRLTDGTATATALGRQLPITRQAVAKHLTVLQRAGLVRAVTAGREKRYRVDNTRLALAVTQLASVGTAWDGRLQRVKRLAEAIQQAGAIPPTVAAQPVDVAQPAGAAQPRRTNPSGRNDSAVDVIRPAESIKKEKNV